MPNYRDAASQIKHNAVDSLFCKGSHVEKVVDNISLHELVFTKAIYNKIYQFLQKILIILFYFIITLDKIPTLCT